MGLIKDPWEIGLMRESGARLAEVIAALKEVIKPGITTLDIDALAASEIQARGGIPSFKGYKVGRYVFPATICASPNDQIVHGIPSDDVVNEGTLLSIDIGLIYGGYHSDSAFSVFVGDVPPEIAELLDATEQSMYEGIAQAVPGNRIGDIGHAIQSFIEPKGYGVIREYVGHGIGRALHETPSVPNFGKPRRGLLIKSGMCLAIEPMTTMGGHETKVLDDGWTVVTRDGSLAAHFEHTVAVTPRGPQILTTLDSNI
jgi:methionyl aminopeptidase